MDNCVALSEDITSEVLHHVRLKVVPIARSLRAHFLELSLLLGHLLLLLVLLDCAGIDAIGN